MHIISFKMPRDFWEQYPEAEQPLRRWHQVTKQARWRSLAETRRDFPHADLTGICTIFNIKGNNYRLVSKIYYPSQVVLVRTVLTHAEYDKGKWKYDCEA